MGFLLLDNLKAALYAVSMSNLIRVTITAPEDAIGQIDFKCATMQRSRSSLIAEALREWLDRHDFQAADRAYVDGYLRHPDAVDDIAAVAAGAIAAGAFGDFKARCLDVLDHVPPQGLVVTRHGQPIARIIPYFQTTAACIGSLQGRLNVAGDLFSTGESWQADSGEL